MVDFKNIGVGKKNNAFDVPRHTTPSPTASCDVAYLSKKGRIKHKINAIKPRKKKDVLLFISIVVKTLMPLYQRIVDWKL